MKRLSLALLIVFSLVLAGCSPNTTPTESAAKQPAATESVASPAATGGEKIVIRVWGHQNNSFNQAHQDIINKFMEENPNVEIKFETFPWDVFIQTIQTSLPAGQVADIIEMPGGMGLRYAKGGQLLEVPAEVMTLDRARETYFEAPLGGYVYDGKLYGLPIEFNLEYGGAYVNEEMFKAAGLPYPPQWKGWDEVIADAKKLTKFDSSNAMEVAGLHYTNNDQLYTYFLSGILEQGGQYFAEDGKHFNFNTPQALAVVQKMVDMAQKDKVVDPVTYNAESNWVGTSFAQKLTAIAVLGSWFTGEARITYPDLKFDYVKLPPFMGDQYKFTSVSGWGVVVTKYTQHPEIAWKLAAAMAADPENALHFNLTTGTIPAMKQVANDSRLSEKYPFMKDLVTILPYGVFQGDIVDPSQLEFDIIYPNLIQAIQGIITPEQAVQNIHEEANAMVDNAK
ncbi:MAG: extracellular solute-binding protein [Chloroflexi bacterium]|jgi:multiple sugar transport system substrate-binding protein|uniref:ABC transporter substrate-binding protein n=1 Tax=Candidatus Roseilinea sp. NK_OTU-006 TaxID=2704250 RepID=UPI000F1F22DE|nr:extracellular solute-binding protein [Candidatus Roseilinea sp. NK_OTU-006]RMG65834.1 MAG: extracellular solute-binding protein [Chloroflexota bacterium]